MRNTIFLFLVALSGYVQAQTGQKITLAIPARGGDTIGVSNRINAVNGRVDSLRLAVAPLEHPHNASDIVAGVLASARMGTGTANNSTVLYGDGVWRRPAIVPPTSADTIGTLVNLTSFPNTAILTNLVAQGTTISSVSNELRINGIATVVTTNTTNVPIDINSEKWRFVIRFRANVVAGSQRIGIGTRSTHFRNAAGTNKSVSATFDFSSDNADRGRLIFFTGANNAFTQRAISSAITCNNGNIIELVLEKNGAAFTATATNTNDNTTATINYTYQLQSTTDPVIPNTGRPAIYNLHQANIEVTQVHFRELTPANPFLLVLGDSKSVGYNTTANADRYITQLQGLYPGQVEAWTGFGDELGDAMTWMSLARRLRPRHVLIALGSNDRRNSVTDPILTANLERLRDAFQAVGSEVWFLGMAENTINQAVLYARARAILPPNRLILLTPTLAADGVHLTTAGHNTVTSAIQAAIFN